MRAAEFLRSIADMLASIEDEKSAQPPVIVNVNNGSTKSDDETDETPTDDNVGTFVPPLQTKIELLKKSTNVKSVFDQEAAEDDGPFE